MYNDFIWNLVQFPEHIYFLTKTKCNNTFTFFSEIRLDSWWWVMLVGKLNVKFHQRVQEYVAPVMEFLRSNCHPRVSFGNIWYENSWPNRLYFTSGNNLLHSPSTLIAARPSRKIARINFIFPFCKMRNNQN